MNGLRKIDWLRALSLATVPILAIWLDACTVLPEKLAPPPASATVADASGALPKREAAGLLQRASGEVDVGHLHRMVAAEEAITGRPLIAGNRVKLLVDGPETYAEMFQAMEAASSHIHLETYILSDDEIGERLASILLARASEGLDVRVIYDSVGSLTSEEGFFERLELGGVKLVEFHPVDPTEDPRIWRINHRDHRKLLVVDGRSAFVGGINFSRTYSSSSFTARDPDESMDSAWRDTHLRIDGPVALEYQDLFLDVWEQQTDAAVENKGRFMPEVEPTSNALVRPVASRGGDDDEFEIYSSYLSAIRHARARIWITQAYFAPDDDMLAALEEAARRGVDVRLLVPGISDSNLLLCATRAEYGRLLEAGVRIFELQDAMLHAKTAVIDGVWSTVGSANFDARSFIHNNEVNAIVIGDDFGREMESLFQTDLGSAAEVSLEEWESRPFWRDMAGFFCSNIRHWL